MGTTKQQRADAKFARVFTPAVCAHLEAAHATCVDGKREYRIDTRGGMLRVSVYETWIACRFEDVARAWSIEPHRRTGVNMNPHSGKWNHHYSTQADPALCAAEFLRCLRSVIDPPATP